MQCKGGGESSRYCGRDDEVPALGSDEHEIEALREISSERDREREKDWVPDEAEPSLLRRLRSKPRTSIVGHWDGVVMRAAGHQGDETGICIGTGTGTDLAGTGTRCPTSNGNWS
ncbi:hypothetical protein FOA52_011010 [Chlamydomonas sp. UWO 241]|nr:hypothetical protein FOA52_011010 [Chlamydomonas sp. UWO 241]